MIRLERSISQYRNGDPKVIADGSRAQVIFALQDSRTDILRLAEHVERLEQLLCLADEALMKSHGCFPLDRTTDDERFLNDAATAIRKVTGDDYLLRKTRAEIGRWRR